MTAETAKPSQQALRALREDLHRAEDAKIRQIVTVLDGLPANQAVQAVLEPLRPRLAILKLARPLRFTRLLFIPLNALIVPAATWRAEHATIPHSILNSVSATVRAAMSGAAQEIDQMLTGHDTGEITVITKVGQKLWAGAADILATAPEPTNWAATGLRPDAYPPLARGIATVLRSAYAHRLLLRQAELGALQPDDTAVKAIISNLAGAPSEGCAMVFKLLLAQLPNAVTLVRQLVDSGSAPVEKALLQTAIDRGTEDILAGLESHSALTKDLRDGPLADVGREVQRIAGLLEDIDEVSRDSRQRARLHGIKEKLETVCRERFADGMESGFIAPIASATKPVDGDGQTRLETCARALRVVETAGRKLGRPAAYATMLGQASETVQTAAASGCLSLPRALRLVEILSGSDAAEALYRSVSSPAVRDA